MKVSGLCHLLVCCYSHIKTSINTMKFQKKRISIQLEVELTYYVDLRLSSRNNQLELFNNRRSSYSND